MKKSIKKIAPEFLINWYHFLLAFFGALIYGFPSKKLTVIGVTGTHGKTTTVNLADIILEHAGYKIAVASSIKFKIAGKEKENRLKMTMPGRAFLQKFLRQAIKAGCSHAVLEATSEGVLQSRNKFINFDVMVFTNLFKEHLERHGGMENYRTAKSQYFKSCPGTHIINLDDDNAKYFLDFSSKDKIGFMVEGIQSSVEQEIPFDSSIEILKASNVKSSGDSFDFLLKGVKFNINLVGRFNVYNALAAVCVGLSQKVPLKVCREALSGAGGVPGRMEKIIDSPFNVFVDYAFTPDALTRVYQTLKNSYLKEDRGLVCVLGACGGGRDKWKRKVLGKIAVQNCREVIITNEDPYDENPTHIINQVAEGAGKKAQKILDRREAIRKALELAKPSDVVVITGKGSEPWICIENGKKIPWDDRKIVREEFKKSQTANF